MELLFKKSELLDLGKGMCGAIIECCEGQCWVTLAGDSRDHVLRRGGRLEIHNGGQVIITATQPCRVMLKTSKHQEHLEDKKLYKWLRGFAVEVS